MDNGLNAWGKEKIPKPVKIDPKLFIWLIGLIVLWFVFSSTVQLQPPEEMQGTEAKVLFKAVAGSKVVLDKEIMVKKGTSAFDAMQMVATVGYKDYGEMGVLVETINGVKPGTNEFWKLFVNGEEAQVGISSLTIESDATIEWKTEEMQDYTG